MFALGPDATFIEGKQIPINEKYAMLKAAQDYDLALERGRRFGDRGPLWACIELDQFGPA